MPNSNQTSDDKILQQVEMTEVEGLKNRLFNLQKSYDTLNKQYTDLERLGMCLSSEGRYVYHSLLVCPLTNEEVSNHQKMYSSGVCHVCGDNSGGTITHAETKSVYIKMRVSWFSKLIGIFK